MLVVLVSPCQERNEKPEKAFKDFVCWLLVVPPPNLIFGTPNLPHSLTCSSCVKCKRSSHEIPFILQFPFPPTLLFLLVSVFCDKVFLLDKDMNNVKGNPPSPLLKVFSFFGYKIIIEDSILNTQCSTTCQALSPHHPPNALSVVFICYSKPRVPLKS